ncbi:MAG: apolipoprotein N-acyltransferase [Burkholderiales bacterium]|nr:apolipoprotein N-acyltransferase [Burkholderiales bacterium]
MLRALARMVPSALLGAVTLFAFAPFGLWPILPVSLALAFGMIEVAPSQRRAVAQGWAWGFGFFLANVHWIYIALHTFGDLPAPLAVLAVAALAAFLALYPALATWAARRLSGESRAALLLCALPACWMLSEWLRGWVFTGFPWAAIGYSQIPGGPLAGFAPVLGIYGVGGMLAALSGFLAWLMGRHLDRRTAYGFALAAAVCIGGVVLQRVQWTRPAGKPLKVALLQGAIPQNRKWGYEDLRYNLQVYYDQVHQADADLIVTPETAFPIFLHEVPADYLDDLIADANQKHAALIIGAPTLNAKSKNYYNGAVLVTDPKRPANYKSHLVPFGEYVPLHPIFGWVYENLLHIPYNDFTPGGQTQAPLPVRDQRVAADICYEDIFGEELIGNASHATILLNMSNLAWFDGSVALAQHGQIAQARALELGRPALLATNSGTTAIVAPNGRYQATLPERMPAILTGTVQGYDGNTPYMVWSNWAAVILALGVLAGSVQLRRRDREI